MFFSPHTPKRETVRTTKIRTSKVEKNIKNLNRTRMSKVFFKLIRTLKVRKMTSWWKHQKWERWQVDQNVEKNIESQKSLKNTFNVLIFSDAIGNIRTSKVLVHFLLKKLFAILIYGVRKEQNVKLKSITYGVLPMDTKAWGGGGLGSFRLG